MATKNKREPKNNRPKLSIKEKRAAKKAKNALVDPPLVPSGPGRRPGGS